MLLLMMNSSRARPTPAFGSCAKSNASCGLPTFIMIFTGDVGQLAALHLGHLGLEQAVVDVAGVALGAGRR